MTSGTYAGDVTFSAYGKGTLDRLVQTYSKGLDELNLEGALLSRKPNGVSDEKLRIAWIVDVLRPIEEKGTVLIEQEYVDRNYLDDYACFYSRCSTPPPVNCARLHFFGTELNCEEFEGFLSGADPEPFRRDFLNSANYWGFLVVRPLPRTAIGMTCIRLPAHGSWEGASLTVHRRYTAHLLGQALEIDTLAFQETDESVSSCAAAALWSAFQATSILFDHGAPTPAAIARAATLHPLAAPRWTVTSDGLSDDEMAEAVRAVSLEALLENFEPVQGVLRLAFARAYAYLKAGIPVILSGYHAYRREIETELERRSTSNSVRYSQLELVISGVDTLGRVASESQKRIRKEHAMVLEVESHSMTLVGYGPFESSPERVVEGGPLIRNLRPKWLHTHDDGIGPWAPLWRCFDYEDLDFDLLVTEWSKNEAVYFRVDSQLVPLRRSIRIKYDVIYDFIAKIHESIVGHVMEGSEDAGSYKKLAIEPELEWEIFLCSGNRFKEEVDLNPTLDSNQRRSLLMMRLPLYLWRAVGYNLDTPAVEFLFDASDIIQGRLFLCAVEYDAGVSEFLHHIDFGLLLREAGTPGAVAFYKWFSGVPKTDPASIFPQSQQRVHGDQ